MHLKDLSKFLFLIGIALFVILLLAIGPEKINDIFLILLNANPIIFIIAIALIIPSVFLKGLKQSMLLEPFGKKIPLKESCEIWLSGYLLAALSPGRSGDFLRAVYFKKNYNLSLGNGVSAIMLERVIDVGFLLIGSVLGVLYFSIIFSLGLSIIALLCLALALFVFLFFLLSQKKAAVFVGRPFFNFLVPKKLKEKIRKMFHDFYNGLGEYAKNKKIVFFTIIVTIASWFLFFVQAYLLALSLNIPISIWLVFAMIPLTTLAEIIPTVFGIGARDFTLLGLFAAIGLSVSSAMSLSLTILLVEIIEAFFGMIFLRKIKN